MVSRSDSLSKRLHQSEAKNRKQQALIGQQHNEIRRLNNTVLAQQSEIETLRAELRQERESCRVACDNVKDLLHAKGAGPSTGKDRTTKNRQRPNNAGGRNPLPDDLPREQSVYTPPENHPSLRHATVIDQVSTRIIPRLDIRPAQAFVREYECPVMQLRLANGSIMQETITPPSILGRGQATDRFLVTSVLDKVQDHLPAYRQQVRFARGGFEIERNKLCRCT